MRQLFPGWFLPSGLAQCRNFCDDRWTGRAFRGVPVQSTDKLMHDPYLNLSVPTGSSMTDWARNHLGHRQRAIGVRQLFAIYYKIPLGVLRQHFVLFYGTDRLAFHIDPAWPSMKLSTTLLPALALLLYGVTAMAQPVVCRISFDYRDQPLEQAMYDLIRHYELPVMFKSNLLKDHRVTAACKDCSVDQALERLLSEADIGYRHIGAQYILSKGANIRYGISGQVLLKGTGKGVAHLVIALELDRGNHSKPKAKYTTDEEGRFSFDHLSPGRYLVSVLSEVYSNKSSESISIDAGHPQADVVLEVNALSMAPQQIVVSNKMPGFPTQLSTKQELPRAQNRGFQGTPGNLFSRLSHLPGVVAPDWSAGEIGVQGSAPEDTAVYLDGALIDAPSHFTASGSPAQGLIDDDVVDHFEFIGSALPIEYGDSIGGVLNLTSGAPTKKLEASLSASFVESKVRTAGTFAGDRGLWFFNYRLGDSSLVDRFRRNPGSSFDKYAGNEDLMGKIQYFFGESQLLSLHLLQGQSESSQADHPDPAQGNGSFARSHEDNRTNWLNLRSFWSDRLWSETVVTWSDYSSEFHSNLVLPSFYQREIHDVRGYRRECVAQDWNLELGSHQFKWGMKLRRSKGAFAYEDDVLYAETQPDVVSHGKQDRPEDRIDGDTPRVPVNHPSQGAYEVVNELGADIRELGFYAGERSQINDKLAAELAIRFDRQSLTSDHQWSPRVNLSYQVDEATNVQLNWGRFYQARTLYQLDLSQRVNTFAPAELGEHSVLTLDRSFGTGIRLHGELYRKAFSSLRNRSLELGSVYVDSATFENGETLLRPSSGEASGCQVSLRGEHENGMEWQCNYALSRAEDVINGARVRRQWDQRHAVNAVFTMRFANRLSLGGAWSWHSGWPVTEVWLDEVPRAEGGSTFVLRHGELNGANLPVYQRLDLRIDHTFTLEGERKFYWYMEILNVLNHRNVSGYEYDLVHRNGGSYTLSTRAKENDSFMPMIGMRWDF